MQKIGQRQIYINIDSVSKELRSAYPMLADENLDLVSRELERIRRLRYDLPAGPAPAVTENRTARASGSGPKGTER